VHPFDGAKSRVQSLEMKGDSWCESNRKRPKKVPRHSIRFSVGCVTIAEFALSLKRGRMRNGRSLGVVCGDEDAQSDRKDGR